MEVRQGRWRDTAAVRPIERSPVIEQVRVRIYQVHKVASAIQVYVSDSGPKFIAVQASVPPKAFLGKFMRASRAALEVIEDALDDPICCVMSISDCG